MDGIQNRNLTTDLSGIGKPSQNNLNSNQPRSDSDRFQMELEKETFPNKKMHAKEPEARLRVTRDENSSNSARSNSSSLSKSTAASSGEDLSDKKRDSDDVGQDKLATKEDSQTKKSAKSSPATRSALAKIAAQMKQSGEDPQTASPVLGVLTGKNSSVALEEIPALVTSSPFVMQALGSDISQYLSTPQTIESLATNLDLDDEVLERALTMGIDPMVKVSPREFLMALGIDPQKITAELVKIRDRGAIDGLGVIVNSFKKVAETEKDPTSDIPIAKGTAPIKTPEDLARISKIGSEITSTKIGAISNPTLGNSKAEAINGDGNFFSTFLDEALSKNQYFDKNNGFFSGKISSDSEVSNNSISDFIFSSAEKSTKDPFDLMASQIMDVQTMDLNAMPDNYLPISQLDALSSREFNSSDIDLKDISSELHRLGIENNKNVSDFLANIESPENKSIEGNFFPSEISFIAEDRSGAKNFDSQSGSETTSDNSKQEESSQLAQVGSSASSGKSPLAANFSAVFEDPTVTSSDKVANIRDIFDKAQLLVSQGGGSMRIDIGGSSPVSLAIKVMEGEVSLKIATDSERMRDLIASEIPKLQESMASQNLKLSQVDLGKNMSSSARDGQSGRDLSQQFQFQQQNQRQPQNNGESMASSLRRPLMQRPAEVTSLEKVASSSSSTMRNNLGKLLVRV